MYPEIAMFIGGAWRREGRELRDVINPATGQAVGRYPVATAQDLDDALAAAARGFETWRNTPAADRGDLIRKAGAILASRADEIAPVITLEQGKPLGSARFEPIFAQAELNWFAEEAVRSYGRVIPAREAGQRNLVVKEPIGPALIIAPWNYPMLSPNVKIGAALAAGCSVIVKPSEETPGGCMELVRAFADAGLPEGVLNMVTGEPDMIARHCLGSPVIRKLSFTGSTQVGKHLVGLTTQHLQVPTMELGGHAPVIVHEDVDVEAVAGALVAKKLQNGGQVCLSPTRFYIHEAVYAPFIEAMVKGMSAMKIGDGMAEGTTLGPMINAKRVDTLEAMTRDAVEKGARLVTGGERVGNTGFFFAPTVLADVPDEAWMMQEEPFGPIVPCQPYTDLDAAIAKANSLPYGLNAYAFATSRAAVQKLGSELQSGIVSINRTNAVYPETPMGGVKSSGYGKELGAEGLDAYMTTKFISENDPMGAGTAVVARG